MQFNQVFFDKFMLNISAPAGINLHLNHGEIIKGQVQAVKDNGLITIFIKGQLIEAASEVLVKSGQELFLMVDGFREGKAYLKVLTPENLGRMENVNLSVILNRIGIEANTDNINLAKKLLQYNLPLTKENLNTLSLGVKILGVNNAANQEIAAFALSKGLPINNEVLSALNSFIENRSDLSELVSRLRGIMNSLEHGQTANGQRGTQGITITVSTDLAAISKASGEQIKAAYYALNTPTASVAKTGDASVQQPVLPAQNEAGYVASNQSGQVGNMAGISEAGKPVAFSQYLSVLKPLVDGLILNLNMQDENTGIQISAKFAEQVKAQPDLLRSLLIFQELINHDENINRLPQLAELAGNIDRIEKEMAGQRLFNYTQRIAIDNTPGSYYLSFPVNMNGKMHLCQLRIDKQAGTKNLQDMDNLSLAVGLNTERLGNVVFHVKWSRSKYLDIEGLTENEQVGNFLSSHLDSLLDGLRDLGYKVNNHGIRTAGKDENEFILRPHLQENAVKRLPFGIDVTV